MVASVDRCKPDSRANDEEGQVTMGIISWLVLGTIIGYAANRLVPGHFPGGGVGTVVGGATGAFLGGAAFSLLVDRGVSGVDPLSLLTAFIGAVLLLTVVRKADYAEPHPS